MIRYVITTHEGRVGAALSRPGQWGNRPFSSVEVAEHAARIEADAAPYHVEREHVRARRNAR